VLAALVFGALFLKLSGFDPLAVYGACGEAPSETPTPLGNARQGHPDRTVRHGITVAFRIGPLEHRRRGTTLRGRHGCHRACPFLPRLAGLRAAARHGAAGMAAGALWALIAAIPRAWLGVNEILTTLMLNYVAIFWSEYLITDPGKTRPASTSPSPGLFRGGAPARIRGYAHPRGHPLCAGGGGRPHGSAAQDNVGYEVRLIGSNPVVAKYAGISIPRHILIALAVSGALAGLAGWRKCRPSRAVCSMGSHPATGYSAIIVAWLAKLSPAGILVMSFLSAGCWWAVTPSSSSGSRGSGEHAPGGHALLLARGGVFSAATG